MATLPDARSSPLVTTTPPVASIMRVGSLARSYTASAVSIVSIPRPRALGLASRSAAAVIIASGSRMTAMARSASSVASGIVEISSGGIRDMFVLMRHSAQVGRAIATAKQAEYLATARVGFLVAAFRSAALVVVGSRLLSVSSRLSQPIGSVAFLSRAEAARTVLMRPLVIARASVQRALRIIPFMATLGIGSAAVRKQITTLRIATTDTVATIVRSGFISRLSASFAASGVIVRHLGKGLLVRVTTAGRVTKGVAAERMAVVSAAATTWISSAAALLAAVVTLWPSQWRGIGRPTSEREEGSVVDVGEEERIVKAGTGRE